MKERLAIQNNFSLLSNVDVSSTQLLLPFMSGGKFAKSCENDVNLEEVLFLCADNSLQVSRTFLRDSEIHPVFD